jgi:hypothetical protein
MNLYRYKFFCLNGFILFSGLCQSQGLNHNFLLGYDTTLSDTNVSSPKGRLLFDTNAVAIMGEQRKMPFWETQGNISDSTGNLIISSNGCWIADASGDTMLNGSGINPGTFTTGWNTSVTGLPLPYGCIILPYPNDLDKYIMFHMTGNNNANLSSTELYYSEINISLAGGLGGVTQKNLIAVHDTLSWGIGACKHSNGRDWWVVVTQDISDSLIVILFSQNGVASISRQSFNLPSLSHNACQPVFSPDGKKFAFSSGYNIGPGNWYHDVRLFDFDRCSGLFSNPLLIDLQDSIPGFAVAFSPNSKYLYVSSVSKIYQFNTDTSNIASSKQTVAVYDGFTSPNNHTNFWLMYLAANGKIYLTSGANVIDLHYINYPDSGGIACDVQQHALHIPCYHVGSVPNHPNYYLGCDTIGSCACLTGIEDNSHHDFRFRIYPNPILNNILNIGYLFPQNKSGLFQIYDINGKIVFKYTLPPWSNEQSFKLPELINGIYNCVIISETLMIAKKIVSIQE